MGGTTKWPYNDSDCLDAAGPSAVPLRLADGRAESELNLNFCFVRERLRQSPELAGLLMDVVWCSVMVR